LKKSKVLLVNIKASNSELARHLIFSGISISLLDDSIPKPNERLNNFLLAQATKEETVIVL